jgi:dipeptidyl-peptidase 4
MTRRLALALLLLLALPLAAQKKQLTLEDVYDPKARIAFGGAVQSGFQWLDDATLIWPKKDEKGKFVEWRVYEINTGKQRPLIDRAKLQKALEGTGLPADVAADAAESDELEFDAKKSAIVAAIADDLYLYSFNRGTAVRLTSAPGEEEVPMFSPDGQRVAFVRDNDLYAVDLAGRERRLTTDGSATTLNGKLDWVYQEEVYGRGRWKSYWWSADSSRIAFLQLDETPVPEYTVVDHLPYRPELQVYPYPKAGDPNPRVALKIVPAMGGKIVTVDNARYSGGEFLIVNVDWDKNTLTYQVQNREQTWLDLATASTDGKSKTLFRETTKAWVDPIGQPVWLADGTFLWLSERSGWRHIYHYKADGTPIRQITNGEWEARDLHGSDGTFVYFSGTERSHIGGDVYRIRLDGTGMQRLSNEPGTHTAGFNDSLTHYVSKWSDIRTPEQIRIHTADGKILRVFDENRVAVLGEYALSTPELMQVKTRDGFVMEAMMLKPPNFDPSKKYPVYQFTYGGPHAQSVRNVWPGTRGMFHQLVAQQGVIVWICDNRTASGKGAVSAWHAYKNFGESELRDVEDGIAWLKQQPYIDGSRIMLSGWSYGGFMVAYAMTHSKIFSAGISGAPVTDWRDYDSIYTERLMMMPQNNPEGYEKASPRFAAKDLHGRLLLIHGTTDDNVHVQNTMQFAWELQQAGKPFEMMVYPKTRHTVTDKKTQYHLQGLMLDFIKRELVK